MPSAPNRRERAPPMRLLMITAMLLALAGCASSRAPTAAGTDELRFSGVIEAVDDGCLADGVCSLTIDGREVVWMVGWSREPWGKVEVERTPGTPVQVWCRRTASGCELRGNAAYYVRAAR